ncbi:MAG: hypothetical protein AAB436_03050 [Patescibacteria group bacterium]
MKTQNQTVEAWLELVNHYPSPHNGQPIRIKQIGESSFDLYFEKQRGLKAADISYIFSFVSMGVFVEHMSLCARGLGHGFSFKLDLPKEGELKGEGIVKFASCDLTWGDGQTDEALIQALNFRQTSRKKYYEGVDQNLSDEVIKLASDHTMTLRKLDKQQTKQAVWLNQRAVFDDMFDDPVREELNHWLRYSQKQKQAMRDGLAYDCMEISGRLMKFTVDHRRILRAPGISKLIQQYYLRTMTDSSDVFYMMAPFATEQHAFDIGTVIMKVWERFASKGYYLHPFGTIMSNHAAHQDFLKLVGVTQESRDESYLVFIFRGGKSEPPVPSLRIPINEHLIME